MEELREKYQFLGFTKNRVRIIYDLAHSHASTHIADTPGLMRGLWEMIPQLEPNNTVEDWVQTKELSRVIGQSDLVENQPDDEIVYAIRLKRDKYAPFNMSQKAQDSNLVTGVLKPHVDDETTMILHTAWVGPVTPSLPGGEDEMTNSKEFWSKHSLAWGNQAVYKDTIVDECPW